MVKTTAQIFHHAFTRKPSKRKCNQANIKMQCFQSGYLIIDFHFHPCHRPAGRFCESKHYFSGKHHEYGIKTTVHLADSRMIYCSGHSPGSTHDFQQFKDNVDDIKRLLVKRENERTIADNDVLHEVFPDQWLMIGDNAYTGADQFVRLKSVRMNPRTQQERTTNEVISSSD